MPTTVTARSTASAGAPFQRSTIERRDLAPNDVRIDIAFAGICHSDIHTARGEWGQVPYPLVPGHEIAGTVAEVGPEVTKYAVGDRVGVGCFVDSCRECENCLAGEEQYCSKGETGTYAAIDKYGQPTAGGYSQQIVVDEEYVLGIPEGIGLDAAAPLLCAGITLYSPLKHWGAGPGTKVAIVGLGGLGHMGVKIAHALGAEVTVLSQSLKKQEDGLRLGADHYYATSDPETFAVYYATDAVALVSEAWLGPGYQVTSQVNVVNPGGKAQVAHRDYHLGFMSEEQAVAFPAHVHRLSPALTLQGAVAHCDMPVVTGPTMYLPHSQKYPPGYVAFHRPEFSTYFDEHHVQLPLEKGDAVFFNPALFHGAGTNRTPDVRRMANLLQVSSPFGRAMESVDRTAMCRALQPVLRAWQAAGADERSLRNVVAASAEGYAFPTNLDRDQPIGGLAPETQAQLVWRALAGQWPSVRFEAELTAQAERRTSAG